MMRTLLLPPEVRQLTGTWLVGLSGGADSVALTRLLLTQCPGADFAAVHVNHGLRGDESDADEAFVSAFCKEQGIPLYTRQLIPPPHPGEDWARNERYAVYRSVAQQTGAQGILLAHHRTDQAETLLLHLLRGSGLDGLCGMQAESVSQGLRILRPLLASDPQDLRAYLRQLGQTWREDSSNRSDAYLRNRIRHELLPLAEQLAPGAAERIAAAAEALQPDADLLRGEAELLLSELPPYELPVTLLKQQPQAIVRRLLRDRCRELTGELPDRERTQAMLRLIDAPTGKQVDLPGGICARAHDRLLFRIRCETEDSVIPVNGHGSYTLGAFTLTIGPGGIAPGNGRTVQELPADLLTDCVLRYRRSGDRIRPFGMKGSKSLQDWFVDRRIPAVDRDRIPLLCRGDEVLLVAGCGAGGIPRWQADEDNVRLIWSGVQAGLNNTEE